jgi:hypothetical protein
MACAGSSKVTLQLSGEKSQPTLPSFICTKPVKVGSGPRIRPVTGAKATLVCSRIFFAGGSPVWLAGLLATRRIARRLEFKLTRSGIIRVGSGMGAQWRRTWKFGRPTAGRGSGLGTMRFVEEQFSGMPWGSSAGNWPKSISKNLHKKIIVLYCEFQVDLN